VTVESVGTKVYSPSITRNIKRVIVSLVTAAAIEAVPEEFWPAWMRLGNEWIIKHRVLTCQNHV
jgi:hypothetical protein